MLTSQLIKSIRSKYVGTADEHSLLSALEQDAQSIETEAQARAEEEFTEKRASLDQRLEMCQRIELSARIDCEAFYLLRDIHEKRDANYAMQNVASAMKGRGLTRDLLMQIAEKME